MEYWWCKGDIYGNYRGLENFGPSWPPLAYYDEESKKYPEGPFEPGKTKLVWEKKSKFPIPDFLRPANSVLTCRPEKFSLFQGLIEGCYKAFPLFVEGEEYVSFRPNKFLDLLDHENSEYHVLKSGTYSNFRKIVIVHPHANEEHFFGLEGQLGIRMKTIVSGKFKEIYDVNSLTGLVFSKANRP